MAHRSRSITSALLTATLAGACASAMADDPPIVPQVDQRDVAVPRFPSNDLELGAFIGTYATQNFGASNVRGVRLGYNLTEDFFVQAAYGQTKVSDAVLREVLAGPVIDPGKEKLTYYNFSVGYNVLPGEVFIGGRRAKPSALYLIAGVGSTEFNNRKRQTINFGAGFRVMLADWSALQLDARNHVFSLDLLGKQQRTNNLEFTAGATFIF